MRSDDAKAREEVSQRLPETSHAFLTDSPSFLDCRLFISEISYGCNQER
jgi:hypothetical protein